MSTVTNGPCRSTFLSVTLLARSFHPSCFAVPTSIVTFSRVKNAPDVSRPPIVVRLPMTTQPGALLLPVIVCGPYTPAAIAIRSPGWQASQAASIDAHAVALRYGSLLPERLQRPPSGSTHRFALGPLCAEK